MRGGIVGEFGMGMDTLLYLTWRSSEDLLDSNKELCSVSRGSLDGRGVWGRMHMCICMAEFLHCSPETTIIFLIGYTPIQNKT